MEIGDKVRTNKFCGIEGMVVFWDYEGILIRTWDVPEYNPPPEAFSGDYHPAKTRALVYRNNDPKDWFCCDLESLEVVCP